MNTLRDYIARTQQDRIALDTLAALEAIRDLLTPVKTIDPPMITIPDVKIVSEVIAPIKRARKAKGDK